MGEARWPWEMAGMSRETWQRLGALERAVERVTGHDAGAEIERLRSALNEVRSFLTKPGWGNSQYMEGSEIYRDNYAAVSVIDAALRG